ncbi:MAG TPA: hypothetical protein VN364_06895 [Bellilinea sp.]|nr:hypothetical protein [Bellilinea sp.]
MVYLPNPDGILVWNELSNPSEVSLLGKNGQIQKIAVFPDAMKGVIGAVYDPLSSQLLLMKTGQILILGLSVDNTERVNITDNGSQPIDISELDLNDPTGFTRNPANGDLYILDNQPTRILRLSLGADNSQTALVSDELRLSKELLNHLENQVLNTLAFNPESYSMFTVAQDQQVIYEISMTGSLLSTLTLNDPPLDNIRSLMFAPGVNQSDDPLAHNLFILDSGVPVNGSVQPATGRIVEITLHPTKLPIGIVLRPSYLVKSFSTNKSVWIENSPDPSGIAYLPETGELILVDSEVDEFPPLDTLPNVFYLSTNGDLNRTANTYKFATETSGIAVNPFNNHYFFSDDNVYKVFELYSGADNTFWTEDDIRIDKPIEIDIEDITFGNNTIFVAGGNQGEILSFSLGADGIISADDDDPKSFNTDVYGFSDVEGIAFNEETGTLFIISTASNDTYLGEFSLTGRLLNAWDLAYIGGSSNLRSGLTFAPASEDPSITHLYIVSRGVDNNVDPDEDDGKVTEISLIEPDN